MQNETNLFIQIKLYNQTQKRVTTLNLIDLVGCQHMTRSIRPHISRDKIEQNKGKNVNLFSLNKLLHHLCNLHLQNQDNINKNNNFKNSNKDMVENVIAESLLNNFIGPMITQNAESIFLGTVSCNASDYQSSLRTIQVLSRTLSIKVPCMHTPWNQDKTNQLSIISFQQFLTKWQSILYKHMMIENSIKEQMNKYQQNNITQAIEDFEISMDERQLNTQILDDQLQELKKNIPQNVFESNNNNDSKYNQYETKKDMKQEISSLLDDILEPKPQQNTVHHTAVDNGFIKQKNQEMFLKSQDFEDMLKSTKSPPKYENFIVDMEQENIDNTNQENKTVAHLEFTNLRLANCKLQEEIRKLKSQSKYSSIFDDYDREITTLNKLLTNMSHDNKLLSLKNMQLKQDLGNYKLRGNIDNGNNKGDELKTVRILQKTLRDTTKKLKEKEIELMKLSGNIRHCDIRNRVLQTSKDEWYEMSQVLNERENELGKSYLSQAKTQANVDRLELIVTELQHENNTLQTQNKSLENEVATLRHLCKKINDDIRQRNQLHRVSKKWSSSNNR